MSGNEEEVNGDGNGGLTGSVGFGIMLTAWLTNYGWRSRRPHVQR